VAVDDLSEVDRVIEELTAARAHIDDATEAAEDFVRRHLADSSADTIAAVAADVEATSAELAAELQRVRDEAAAELEGIIRRDARRRIRAVIEGRPGSRSRRR
jgi:hypothetical protein